MEDPNINQLLNTVKKLTGQLRSIEGLMSSFPHETPEVDPSKFDVTSLLEAEALVQRIEREKKSPPKNFKKKDGMETESDDEPNDLMEVVEESVDPQFQDDNDIDPSKITDKGYQISNDAYIPLQIFDHLMSHQPSGISFIYHNLELGRGCILADFMGLGKSIQSLVALHLYKLKHPKSNFLILCPLNVSKHWEKEVGKVNMWIDQKNHLQVMNLNTQKTLRSRLDYLQLWKTRGCILVCTYEMFKILNTDVEACEYLCSPGPTIALLDEGHKLRHSDTNIYKAIAQIGTSKRIILTGYPFQNNLIEYYTMINFVRPDHLGDIASFRKLFEKPISQGKDMTSGPQKKQVARRRAWLLHNRLLEVILRRDSSLLKKILPEKHEVILVVNMTPLQREVYEKLMIQVHTIGTRTLLFWIYDCITMLVNHPDVFFRYISNVEKNFEKPADIETQIVRDSYVSILKTLFDKDYAENKEISAKFEITKDIIKECVKEKDKLVIFSKSIMTLNYFEQYLKDHNEKKEKMEKINYARFDGSTNSESRENLIEKFNAPNSAINLFLISTLAGGEGINLFAANRIVLFDVNWNPSHDSEATCRVYRYGQKKNVWIYRLVSHDTMEDVIFKRQLKKEMVGRWVIDDTSSSITNDISDNKQLFVMPDKKEFDKETFEGQIAEIKDDVTLHAITRNREYIHELHFQDELLREDESFSLNVDEQKRAYTEEEWETVYGRKVRARKERTENQTPKHLDDHMKRLSKNSSPSVTPKKGTLPLDDDFDDEDDEDWEDYEEIPPIKKKRTEEIILEQKEKLTSLRVNTAKSSLPLDVSPLGASPGSDQKTQQHKKLEEERKKLISNQLRIATGNTDFRRLVREQMNDFKKKCLEFYEKNK